MRQKKIVQIIHTNFSGYIKVFEACVTEISNEKKKWNIYLSFKSKKKYKSPKCWKNIYRNTIYHRFQLKLKIISAISKIKCQYNSNQFSSRQWS